jgi:hypothetical protein
MLEKATAALTADTIYGVTVIQCRGFGSRRLMRVGLYVYLVLVIAQVMAFVHHAAVCLLD